MGVFFGGQLLFEKLSKYITKLGGNEREITGQHAVKVGKCGRGVFVFGL